MKKSTRILSSLMVLAMMASFAACAKKGEGDTTTEGAGTTTTAATTTVKKESSTSVKVESDYDVEKVKAFKVDNGTSEADVIAKLPTELQVTMPADGAPTKSDILFTESFDDENAFNTNWTLCDPHGVSEIAGGVIATLASSTNFKAAINDQAWAKTGTEEYANYAVTIKIKGTADAPTNNFGMILRASEVTGEGPDSYYGLYVGIGDSNGAICIGYAENNWNGVDSIDIDYVPGQEYELTTLLFNEKFVVLLDGEKKYEGKTDFVNGTAGIRTYNQLFETSEVTVRTLNADDYKMFEDGYVEIKSYPVVWTCTDYDPATPGKYRFVGTIQGLDKAATSCDITVKSAG